MIEQSPLPPHELQPPQPLELPHEDQRRGGRAPHPVEHDGGAITTDHITRRSIEGADGHLKDVA